MAALQAAEANQPVANTGNTNSTINGANSAEYGSLNNGSNTTINLKTTTDNNGTQPVMTQVTLPTITKMKLPATGNTINHRGWGVLAVLGAGILASLGLNKRKQRRH